MSFIQYSPGINDININVDDILEMLHETDRSPDNPVVSEANLIYRQLQEIYDIRGGYIIYNNIEILRREGKIKINGRNIEPREKVCGYMEDARQLAVFVCTAGEGFSTYSDKYNKEGDYLKGFIVDAFGSLIVEKSMDYIQNELEKESGEYGMRITNRYSPGYCNWQVQDQKQLFSLLPDNPCNITLSESCLMIPIKSISGIIGIGKKVHKREYSCDICTNTTCVYRKVKNKG